MRKWIRSTVINCSATVSGALFFTGLLIYDTIARWVNGFKEQRGWPRLTTFREHEHGLLDVDIEHAPVRIDAIDLGTLPARTGDRHSYSLPQTGIPDTGAMLIRIFVPKTPAPHRKGKYRTEQRPVGQQSVELEYTLSDSEDLPRRTEPVFLFSSPFEDQPELHFNEGVLWYPIPESRRITVELVDVQPAGTVALPEIRVEIVGIRIRGSDVRLHQEPRIHQYTCYE